jgi:hypothetical protein
VSDALHLRFVSGALGQRVANVKSASRAGVLVALVALSSFGGAVSAQTPARQGEKPIEGIAKKPERTQRGPCDLGLISIVGNKFDIFDTSPSLVASLFVGERSSTRADWDLDDLVLSRVRAAAPGVNVRMINYDKEELRRSAQNRSMFGSFSADIRDFGRQVASGTTCHRYLIVHRASSLISSHQANVTGIGVVNVRGPLAWVGAYLYALTEMRLYDGPSFELIKQATASLGDEPTTAVIFTKPFKGPLRQIDVAAFPTRPEQAGTNQTFRAIIRSLLASSLDHTLPTLLHSQ